MNWYSEKSHAHCGTCAHHGFVGLENFCEIHKKTIPRSKWDKKRKDGSSVCSCSEYRDWTEKKIKRIGG